MLKIVLTLLCLLAGSDAAKVLIYQIAFSPSHLTFSGRLADLLVERGHVVDKVIVMYNSGVKSNGSRLLRHVHRVEVEPNPFMTMSHLTDPFKFERHSRKLRPYMDTKTLLCRQLLNDEQLLQRLREERYDVFLASPYDLCGLALRWHLDVPVQLGFVATAWDELSFLYLGLPTPPSYVMDVFEDRVFTFPMGLRDRLTASVHLLDRMHDEFGNGEEEVLEIRRRFPDIPQPRQLFQHYIYIFYNTNELLDLARPVSAKVKYVGGLAAQTAGQMPKAVERVLARPGKGVVVFSLGSLFDTRKISAAMKREFLAAFRQLPDFQFLWKLTPSPEDAQLFQDAPNVARLDWLPQTALLQDARVKAFISHMGLNSYTELATAGKPVVALPLFADQFYNAACALENGLAVLLDRHNLSSASILTALRTVLEQPRYAQNAQKLARMIRTRPLKPAQEFHLFFDYALLNPELADTLQLGSVHLPLWRYLNLDLVLLAVLGALLALGALLGALRTVHRLLRRGKEESRQKTD